MPPEVPLFYRIVLAMLFFFPYKDEYFWGSVKYCVGILMSIVLGESVKYCVGILMGIELNL